MIHKGMKKVEIFLVIFFVTFFLTKNVFAKIDYFLQGEKNFLNQNLNLKKILYLILKVKNLIYT
jgi:hypothetical protein